MLFPRLSGPAGGVVGYAMTSKRGMPVIGFDMGGTSTDVSRYGGGFGLGAVNGTAGERIPGPQRANKNVGAGEGAGVFVRKGVFWGGC